MAKMGSLLSYLMVFVMVGIVSIIGLYIIASVYGQLPASATASATNCNGANLTTVTACITGTSVNYSYTNSTSAISTVMSWLPIIGIVFAAAVVLGILLHDLFGKSG